jgi:hypothetical protein
MQTISNHPKADSVGDLCLLSAGDPWLCITPAILEINKWACQAAEITCKNKKAATELPSGARQLACGQKWEPDTVAARL